MNQSFDKQIIHLNLLPIIVQISKICYICVLQCERLSHCVFRRFLVISRDLYDDTCALGALCRCERTVVGSAVTRSTHWRASPAWLEYQQALDTIVLGVLLSAPAPPHTTHTQSYTTRPWTEFQQITTNEYTPFSDRTASMTLISVQGHLRSLAANIGTNKMNFHTKCT